MTDIALVPPQNLEAENAVLAAVLHNGTAIEAAEESNLRPEDFYQGGNNIIFKTASAMHARGEAVDAITLADELTTLGLLERVGGKDRLDTLAGQEAIVAHVPQYAQIVREMSVLRSLIQAGQKITRLGLEHHGELDELIAQAEDALTSAVDDSEARTADAMTEGADDLIAEIRAAYLSKKPITGTLTGLRDLDNVLSGLWPGQLVILAARPSLGKSTLALNIAENIAERGPTVLFVSLEMSRREFQIKSLARATQIDSKLLGRGSDLREEDAKKLGAKLPNWKVGRSNIIVHDLGTATVATVRAEANRLKRRHDLGAIIVDYLQLMTGSGEESRQQEISAISRSLKQLARKLDVPVLALSQMNRNTEGRADKRPVLSDLRESGALEQDADVVLFLHADHIYDPDKEDDGTIEIIVAKQRHGPTGSTKVAFTQRYSSFKNLGGGLTS
jgi:replicative DNA helicase